MKGLAITAGLLGALTYGALSLLAPRFTSESQLEFTAKRNNPFPETGDRSVIFEVIRDVDPTPGLKPTEVAQAQAVTPN